MKIRVTMKRPDALSDGIDEAMSRDSSLQCLDDEEREAVEELRREKYHKLAGRWFEHGEYLTVEIDTEAETCTVIPSQR